MRAERDEPAAAGRTPPETGRPIDQAAGPHVGAMRGLTPAVVVALQRSAGNAKLVPLLTAPARATFARAPLDPTGDARIPLPGWGDPQFGDDESAAVFDPSGSYWRDGAGMGPPAVASFNEDDGFTGTVTMRESGEVRLVVDSHFTIDELADQIVMHRFSARWRVAAQNKWGDLTIKKGRIEYGQTKGLGGPAKEVQLTALESEEQHNTVVLKATFTGSSTSTTGVPVISNDKAYAALTKTVIFKLRIQMEGATLGPKPGPYVWHPHTVYYKTGKYLLNAKQVVELADFLKTHPRAYEALSNTDAAEDQGRVKIRAFASPMGSPLDNLDLADNRAKDLRKRLEQLGVRHGNITEAITPGELGGKAKGEPPGNAATPSEQRVEIELPERRAED